jgi:hypothetical protein
MIQVRPSALFLAAPLFLGLVRPADELEFHPKAGAELKKSLKIKLELKPEKLDFTVNGESMPPENLMGSGDAAMQVKLAVDATDKYVQSKEGRPTDLLRSFESLALSYEAGEEKGDAPKFDKLEGKTVRFKWNADNETYEKSFHESKGDDALLEKLSEDMDVRPLLPPKKVSEGDTWELSGDKVLPLFLPGGLPGEIASDSDKDEAKTAFEEAHNALSKFQDELKFQCKYKGSHEEDGARLGQIEFTFSGKGKADLSHLIETLGAMEDNDVHPDVDANSDLDLSGSGVLLWHLADGRLHSFTMHADASMDLDVKSTFDVDGEGYQMVIKARFTGKADWTLSASKP